MAEKPIGAALPNGKRFYRCECIDQKRPANEITGLEFLWPGPKPEGGQFFMVRAERSGVFLGRPLSAASFKPGPEGGPGVLGFLVLDKGQGTHELCSLRPGETAEISGPLGNSWAAAAAGIPEGVAAFISGGVGVAPLALYASEPGKRPFDFYAGFKSKPYGVEGVKSRSLIIAAEDGEGGLKGRIPDFFSPVGYSVVFSCGPEAMLKTVAAVCEEAGVPCFVSLERRMACGAGACLGCTVKTWDANNARQNSRCCADGPIFAANTVIFDEVFGE
ncbi:MAG: dihydroorotate dehydrogenase electron transfer subunit [Treponema sp.]|jgi:NAD(P)H-flavin reductase|nr:dihydroorotate dehydrogenase electron transfer subunit [Treponema sp.]